MINIRVDYFTVRNTKPLQQKVMPSLTLLYMVTSLQRSVRRNQGLQNIRLIAKPLNIKQMKQNKGV